MLGRVFFNDRFALLFAAIIICLTLFVLDQLTKTIDIGDDEYMRDMAEKASHMPVKTTRND